jgi:cell wall-associated NlpC family hydrolase
MSDATTTGTPTDVSSATADSTAVPASTAPANTNTTTEGTLLSSAPTSTTDAQAQSSEPVEKPDWLPEKFWREDKADVEALSKSYQGLEQLLGKKANSVPVPNEKSTPEEVSAYRKAIGVPRLTGGLLNSSRSNCHEGVSWDENVAKRAAELAHKHNIPAASAMSELMKFDMERAALMNQAAASP